MNICDIICKRHTSCSSSSFIMQEWGKTSRWFILQCSGMVTRWMQITVFRLIWRLLNLSAIIKSNAQMCCIRCPSWTAVYIFNQDEFSIWCRSEKPPSQPELWNSASLCCYWFKFDCKIFLKDELEVLEQKPIWLNKGPLKCTWYCTFVFIDYTSKRSEQ